MNTLLIFCLRKADAKADLEVDAQGRGASCFEVSYVRILQLRRVFLLWMVSWILISVSLDRLLGNDSLLVGWGAYSAQGAPEAPSNSSWIALAAGDGVNVALGHDGVVASWGNPEEIVFATPGGVDEVVAIRAGRRHAIALRRDGSVFSWGANDRGQSRPPRRLPPIALIAAGGDDTVVLTQDGTLIAWGRNTYGKEILGRNLTDLIALATGRRHTLGLRADGTLLAWGESNLPAGLSGVIDVAAGSDHSVALKEDGTVVAWGYNAEGQTTVPIGLREVVAIAAGGAHSVALRRDGTVVAWGRNIEGQTSVPIGLRDVTAIAAGGRHTLIAAGGSPLVLGLPTDLTVRPGHRVTLEATAFGLEPVRYRWFKAETPLPGATEASLDFTAVDQDDAGGYALQVTDARSRVARIPINLHIRPDERSLTVPGRLLVWGSADFTDLLDIANERGVLQVKARDRVVAAILADGSVAEWVQLARRNLGPGVSFPGVDNAVAIAVGGSHRLALRESGEILAWGDNAEGQLNVPTGLNDGIAVAAGGRHSLALSADGRVVAWGANEHGQSTVPVGLTGVVSIAASDTQSMALSNEGRLTIWGEPEPGQISPPDDLDAVIAIASGPKHSLALRIDGTVIAWGQDNKGSTSVPSGLLGVIDFAVGSTHSAVLKADSTFEVWGAEGPLGLASLPIPTGFEPASIAAGRGFTIARVIPQASEPPSFVQIRPEWVGFAPNGEPLGWRFNVLDESGQRLPREAVARLRIEMSSGLRFNPDWQPYSGQIDVDGRLAITDDSDEPIEARFFRIR